MRHRARLERPLLLVVRTGALSEAEPESAAPAETGERCQACGAPVLADQEWCLECGAARTLLRSPPDWRIPAFLIGAIVALTVVAVLIALVAVAIQAS